MISVKGKSAKIAGMAQQKTPREEAASKDESPVKMHKKGKTGKSKAALADYLKYFYEKGWKILVFPFFPIDFFPSQSRIKFDSMSI